jgi:hypothetical protein
MKYTTDRPLVEGFYWAKCSRSLSGGEYETIVRVYSCLGKTSPIAPDSVFWDGEVFSVNDHKLLAFAGPILPPTETAVAQRRGEIDEGVKRKISEWLRAQLVFTSDDAVGVQLRPLIQHRKPPVLQTILYNSQLYKTSEKELSIKIDVIVERICMTAIENFEVGLSNYQCYGIYVGYPTRPGYEPRFIFKIKANQTSTQDL